MSWDSSFTQQVVAPAIQQPVLAPSFRFEYSTSNPVIPTHPPSQPILNSYPLCLSTNLASQD